MSTATMTSKGQVTIPADVRAKLGLRAGTKLDFVTNEKGQVVLRPKVSDVRALRASIPYTGLPLSIEEINEGIGEGAAEAFERSVS